MYVCMYISQTDIYIYIYIYILCIYAHALMYIQDVTDNSLCILPMFFSMSLFIFTFGAGRGPGAAWCLQSARKRVIYKLERRCRKMSCTFYINTHQQIISQYVLWIIYTYRYTYVYIKFYEHIVCT